MYGYHGDKVDKEDDDLNLLPLVVEKILIPKLTGNLFMKWKIPGVLYKEWTCFQFIQYLQVMDVENTVLSNKNIVSLIHDMQTETLLSLIHI